MAQAHDGERGSPYVPCPPGSPKQPCPGMKLTGQSGPCLLLPLAIALLGGFKEKNSLGLSRNILVTKTPKNPPSQRLVYISFG